MPRTYAVRTSHVTICVPRYHRWPRRWSYSKSRRYRTMFCLRCLEQRWQELRGKTWVEKVKNGI